MRFGTESGRPETLDRRGRAYQHFSAAADRIPGFALPRAYNLTVSDDPAFVWYRVAKVGTRTMHRHLASHAHLRLDHPYQVRLPRSGHQGHFRFAFVRNPWDRLVSCWHDKVLSADHFGLRARRDGMRSLPAFVEYVGQLDLDKCDPHLHRQATLINLDRVDFLGRFERFAHDFAVVCRQLGLPEDFRHENRTDHDHYSAYYDEQTAAEVGRLYESDARLFGYEFSRDSSRGNPDDDGSVK